MTNHCKNTTHFSCFQLSIEQSVNKMSCQLPKVEKFLCCLELETGGLVIGWSSAIGSGSVILAIVLIVTSIAYDKDNEETRAIFISEKL
jgi:hypothetical protein